jgi:HAD superfamily hydrolase (TIGR01490 family)
MERLAIYDMDKTITRRPTWTAFLIAAARHEAPWRLALLPLAGLATGAYALKLIDRARLKQITQRLLFGGRVPAETVATVAADFAQRVIDSGTFGAARERIVADKAEGYRLVLATASYRFYAKEIAARLAFDDVIATESRFAADGALLPLIDGENCYGPAKLRMIEAWMARDGLIRANCHIRFYSDHVSDSPVLEWADEPFAVNAHGPLRTLAKARGWPIIDWEH